MGLLMWACSVCDLLDPIKPRGGVGVIWSNNSPVTFQSYYPLPAMSLINNHTFECSMGHQISWEDACFHLHTSDGQHYPSNQQVGTHHLDSFDESNWHVSL